MVRKAYYCNTRKWLDCSEFYPEMEEKSTTVSYKGLEDVVLPRQTQLANLQLALAAFVAGCIITSMLIALLASFCDTNKLRKKFSTMLSRFHILPKISPKADGPVTDADQPSVYYQEVDENIPNEGNETAVSDREPHSSTWPKLPILVPPKPQLTCQESQNYIHPVYHIDDSSVT